MHCRKLSATRKMQTVPAVIDCLNEVKLSNKETILFAQEPGGKPAEEVEFPGLRIVHSQPLHHYYCRSTL